MSAVARPLRSVPIEELLRVGVWKFPSEAPQRDETWVEPVPKVPVSTLAGRIAALRVRLADDTLSPAILGNIDLRNPVLSQHFRTLTLIGRGTAWFDLARYHDSDYDSRGPGALADFLGLPLSAVFPISYDLSGLVLGSAACVLGQIPAEPENRLTKAELIAMAVP